MFKFIKESRTYSAAFLGGVLIMLPLLLASCGGGKTHSATENANTQTTGGGVVSVTTAQAETRGVPSYIQATGNLVAEEQSDVAPQVSGQVIATQVDVGAFVRQGDMIAILDDRDPRIRLQQAQAAEQQASAAVRQAEVRLGLRSGERFDPNNVPEVQAAQRSAEAAQAQIRNIEAQITNAEAQARLAEDTLRRYANLLETGDTPRVVYNQYRTQAEQARANVNAIRAQLNSVRSQANAAQQQYQVAVNAARGNNQGIATAQANLESARAQVALAQKAVNDTVIRAPLSGFVGERPTAVGEYVTPSSRIATIVRTNPIKVRIQLPEADAGRVRVGMGVSVSVAAYPDRQFAGTVSAINPLLEAATRAVIVEADVENGENLLRPNMFATVRLVQSGGEQGVFVPRSAVISDPNTSSFRVYVIDKTTARLTVVQIGEEENGMVRITSGLSGGERVATSNVEQLFDGAEVRQ